MSSPEGKWRPNPKAPERLREQLRDIQGTIGDSPEHSFIPPTLTEEEILSMPVQELKKKYARRYKIFVEMMRDQKFLDSEGGGEFVEEYLDEFRKWLVALNSLDTYIQNHHEGNDVTLREKQITVFEDLRDFVEEGGTEGYIKLPTGVGKTVLFTEFVEALKLKTIIVVPTQILVDQTEDKLKRFAPGVEFGKVYTKEKQFGRQVTIITYDSLIQQVESGTLRPEEYDCLILDEVHQSLSPRRTETVQKFGKVLKIGFTATPEFSKEKKVANLLSTEIHSMKIKEAVEEGLLCSFSSVLARTDVDLSNIRVTADGDYDVMKLGEAVNIHSRNKAAVDLYKQGFAGQTAVAYCVNISHAEALAELFNKEGVSAAVISGETKNKKELVDKFKSGEITVLCNADILITGFDEPKASVCLNLRPTRSRVVAEQRGGRVLRLNEDGAEKHAYVIDFIDKNLSEHLFPILFAHVAGDAAVEGRVSEGGGGGKPGPRLPYIDVEGIEVVTDTEEIMKIVKTNVEYDGGKNFLSFEELQKQVKAAGVNTKRDYYRVQTGYPTWPSNPQRTYKGKGWTSWSEFFNKEKTVFLNLEQLKMEVQAMGIKTTPEYRRERKEHSNWPSSPEEFYENWEGYHDLFGLNKKVTKERYNFLLLFEVLKREVKESGIKSISHYKLVYRNYSGWPSNPDRVYKEWRGWKDFLASGPLTFENLKIQVRQAGIRNSAEYTAVRKSHPNWPSQPHQVYGYKWPGWNEFLGKKK